MFSGGLFLKSDSKDAQESLRDGGLWDPGSTLSPQWFESEADDHGRYILDLSKINTEIDKCNEKIRHWTIELEQTEKGAETARIKGLELKGLTRDEVQSFLK
eukprot:jgi/Hompol1/4901/HPOL_004011-RA